MDDGLPHDTGLGVGRVLRAETSRFDEGFEGVLLEHFGPQIAVVPRRVAVAGEDVPEGLDGMKRLAATNVVAKSPTN